MNAVCRCLHTHNFPPGKSNCIFSLSLPQLHFKACKVFTALTMTQSEMTVPPYLLSQANQAVPVTKTPTVVVHLHQKTKNILKLHLLRRPCRSDYSNWLIILMVSDSHAQSPVTVSRVLHLFLLQAGFTYQPSTVQPTATPTTEVSILLQ